MTPSIHAVDAKDNIFGCTMSVDERKFTEWHVAELQNGIIMTE